MKATFAVLLILLLQSPGITFSQDTTSIEPGGRNKPGFVYDQGRKVFILFGGFGNRGEGIKSDTWEWNGNNWKQVTGIAPSRRGAMGMTYDSKRRKVVLFGGSGDTLLTDTWEWDGLWKQVAVSGPSARSGVYMVYDSRRKKVILYGGVDAVSRKPLNDMWEWDGNKWSLLSSSGSPPSPRVNHSIVYDSRRGRIVLFGGYQPKSDLYEAAVKADTWEWDGDQWAKISDSTGPSKRDHHAMSYDSKRGRVVVFGGALGRTFLNDTWEWDGRQWIEIRSVGPTARGGIPSMAYDTDRKKVILYGGWGDSGPFTDLWEWNGKVWKQIK